MGTSTIQLFNSKVTDLAVDEFQAVLHKGQLASGPYVEQFEKDLCKYTGLEGITSTVDVTMAMRIALHLSGVIHGSEVILSPFNCLSSTSAIAHSGGKAVWAKMNGLFLDLESVKRQITNKTKAVICYHVAGYVCELGELKKLCEEKGVSLIEDCNSAFGGRYADGRHVGAVGDFAVYSFYASRQLNAVEGGALRCNRLEDVNRARLLRKFGLNLSNFRDSDGEFSEEYDVAEIGYAGVMSNVSCYFGCKSLALFEERSKKVKENATLLWEKLEPIVDLRVVDFDPERTNNWVFFVLSPYKKKLIRFLRSRGVNANSLHQRNDQYTGFKSEKISCSSLALIERELVALPVGYWLSYIEINKIAETLVEFHESFT